MFKVIKEFFTGKKADIVAEPTAPYKVETPAAEVAQQSSSPSSEAKQSKAPATKKPAPRRAAADKKPAAKKPRP